MSTTQITTSTGVSIEINKNTGELTIRDTAQYSIIVVITEWDEIKAFIDQQLSEAPHE